MDKPDVKGALTLIFQNTIRTFVPVLVAGIVTWIASTFNVAVDDSFKAALTGGIGALAGTVFYFLVRLAETWVAPWFGFLLGSTRKPVATESIGGDVTVLPDAATAEAVASTARAVAGETGSNRAAP